MKMFIYLKSLFFVFFVATQCSGMQDPIEKVVSDRSLGYSCRPQVSTAVKCIWAAANIRQERFNGQPAAERQNPDYTNWISDELRTKEVSQRSATIDEKKEISMAIFGAALVHKGVVFASKNPFRACYNERKIHSREYDSRQHLILKILSDLSFEIAEKNVTHSHFVEQDWKNWLTDNNGHLLVYSQRLEQYSGITTTHLSKWIYLTVSAHKPGLDYLRPTRLTALPPASTASTASRS